MEVEAASLELLCAVWVVRHGVAAERVAGGTAVPVVVADVVAGVRRWAVGKRREVYLRGGARKISALLKAAGVGSVEGLQFALGETPADERASAKDWALDMAARKGQLDVVRWLVEQGGVDVYGGEDAALQESVAEGHDHVFRWLQERRGFNREEVDRQFLTLHHRAIRVQAVEFYTQAIERLGQHDGRVSWFIAIAGMLFFVAITGMAYVLPIQQ